MKANLNLDKSEYRNSSWYVFGLWLAAALVLDLLTKTWAVSALTEGAVVLADRFALMLVFNTGAAGGVSLGPYTWLINVLGTALTILLVSSVTLPLSKIDSRARIALGLIAGGAAGNLSSLLLESRGVPDFLALHLSHTVIVFNVADVALWIGALILIPVAVTLVKEIRAERRELNMASQSISIF